MKKLLFYMSSLMVVLPINAYATEKEESKENQLNVTESQVLKKDGIKASNADPIEESKANSEENTAQVESQEDVSTWMPDQALQKVVADTLGITPAEITKDIVQRSLYSIDIPVPLKADPEAENKIIHSLQGLEFAYSLDHFKIVGRYPIKYNMDRYHEFSDFSVLNNLPVLQNFDVIRYPMTDDMMPTFSENSIVNSFYIHDTLITDKIYDKLLSIPYLMNLRIGDNPGLTTLAPLKNAKELTELNVYGDVNILDYTPINDFSSPNFYQFHGGFSDEWSLLNIAPKELSSADLEYDPEKQELFFPAELIYSMIPDSQRIINFGGEYLPWENLEYKFYANTQRLPGLPTNEIGIGYDGLASQTLVSFSADRITKSEAGVTITGMTPEEFASYRGIVANVEQFSSQYQPSGSKPIIDYLEYEIRTKYFARFNITHLDRNVKAQYLDEAGNEVAPTETLSGKIGFTYTTEEKEIPGWILKEKPTNASGFFAKDDQIVTYRYTRVDGGNITIKYMDEAGNEVAPSETLTGKLDETYEAQPQAIEGYELYEVEGEKSGTFKVDPQTVVFIYKKVEVPIIPDPEEPEPIVDPPKTDPVLESPIEGKEKTEPCSSDLIINQFISPVMTQQLKQKVINSSLTNPTSRQLSFQDNKKVSRTYLPTTGEVKSLGLLLLGVVSIVITGILFFKKNN